MKQDMKLRDVIFVPKHKRHRITAIEEACICSSCVWKSIRTLISLDMNDGYGEI